MYVNNTKIDTSVLSLCWNPAVRSTWRNTRSFCHENTCVSLFQPALNMGTINLKFYAPLPPSAPSSKPLILAFTAHISHPNHPFHIPTRWQYRSCTAWNSSLCWTMVFWINLRGMVRFLPQADSVNRCWKMCAYRFDLHESAMYSAKLPL